MPTVARPTILPAEPPATEMTYPISSDYIKGWTAERAIGEVIANAIDADPAAFAVTYADGILDISDRAETGVGAEGMILGYSDKRGRTDQIGQFGEGLKIATLVLARDPAVGDVFVETVGYAFSPVIAAPAAVAGVNIPSRGGVAPKVLRWLIWPSARAQGTRVRIVCSQKVADAAMGRFLQLAKPSYVAPAFGARIMVEGEPGTIYIGGVQVSRQVNLLFSYDFSLAAAKAVQNRDRTIVDAHSLNRLVSDALGACVDKDVFRRLVRQAVEGTLADAEASFPNVMSQANQKRILSEIGSEMFAGAVYFADTSNDEAALDLGDRGYEAVAFNGLNQWTAKRLAALLGLRSASQIAAKREVKREQVAWTKSATISTVEQRNLDWAIATVATVFGAAAIGKVKVYDTAVLESGECFEAYGFYTPTGEGNIAVRHDRLADRDGLLETMIHEAGHRLGHRNPGRFGMQWAEYGDRSRGFEHVLGTLAAQAVKMLAEGVRPEAIATHAARNEVAADAVAKDLTTRGQKPAPPGFAWAERVRGQYRYFEMVAETAGEFSKAYAERVTAMGAAAGLHERRHAGAFAKESFVSTTQVKRLMAGDTLGLQYNRWVDCCARTGLNPGVAWWAIAGVAEARKRADRKTGRMGGSVATSAEAATASVETLGPEAVTVAAVLRRLATGTQRADLTSDEWLNPIRRLVEIAVAAS